jgi:hypothetical protein
MKVALLYVLSSAAVILPIPAEGQDKGIPQRLTCWSLQQVVENSASMDVVPQTAVMFDIDFKNGQVRRSNREPKTEIWSGHFSVRRYTLAYVLTNENERQMIHVRRHGGGAIVFQWINYEWSLGSVFGHCR